MPVRKGFVRTPCRKRASRPEVVRTLSDNRLGGGKDRGIIGEEAPEVAAGFSLAPRRTRHSTKSLSERVRHR